MDFQNRQYDPQIGRFLSVDPSADDGQEQWSLYAAMGNNPAMMVDPLGLSPENTQLPANPSGTVSPVMGSIGGVSHAPGSHMDLIDAEVNARMAASVKAEGEEHEDFGGSPLSLNEMMLLAGEHQGTQTNFLKGGGYTLGVIMPTVEIAKNGRYGFYGKWAAWGQQVDAMYGGHLGWDFRGYGHGLGYVYLTGMAYAAKGTLETVGSINSPRTLGNILLNLVTVGQYGQFKMNQAVKAHIEERGAFNSYDYAFMAGYATEKVAEIGLMGLVGGGGTVAVEEGVAEAGTSAFEHGFTYANRVRMRAVEDPVSHNFPYSFDDAVLSTNPILKNNGYKMFQQSGSMNGKDGVFEMGLTKDGIIDHRFFRPNKN